MSRHQARRHAPLAVARVLLRIPHPQKIQTSEPVQEAEMLNVDGLKVAILVTDGFEQVELELPRQALDAA